MHVDDDQLQGLLDGELSADAERTTRQHIAACTECARRLEATARDHEETEWLLRHLDHPATPATSTQIIAMAQRRPFRISRRAAAVLLALGLAGGAYAVQRALVNNPQQETPDPVPAASATAASGIAITPGDSLLILFAHEDVARNIRVWLSDSADVMVRSASAGPAYTADMNRITIGGDTPPADFEIRLPRQTRRIDIRAGSRLLWRKDGARITSEFVVDGNGSYRIMPRAPAR
jgi:hypothetical protein